MPTSHVHSILFATPISVSNQQYLARMGVALYSPGYTQPQRVQILNGTLGYDPGDPEQYNFQQIYSLSADGSTQDYYVGSGTFTASLLGLFNQGLALAPVGCLNVRLSNPDMTVIATAAAAWISSIGQVKTHRELLAMINLICYGPRGLNGFS